MIPRIRTVKPEFFTHSGLYDLEERTKLPVRIAFQGLWVWADREGRFEWKPRELKLGIIPYDPCSMSDVLDALHGAGFVVRYGAQGEYGLVPTFTRHQNVNGRESASTLPTPPVGAIRAQTAAGELLGGFHVDNETEGARDARLRDFPSEATRGARVNGASGSREPHEDHASRAWSDGTEQNGTPLNGTPRNGRNGTHASTSASASTPSTETALARAEANGRGVVLRDAFALSAEPTGSAQALPALAERSASALLQRFSQVAVELRTGARRALKREQLRRLQAEVVFAYWVNKTGRGERTLYDDKRERLLVARLNENGGNVSELLYAIDGALRDPWHNGVKDGEKRLGIQHVMRGREKVEELAERFKSYRDGKLHPTAARYLAELEGADAAQTGDATLDASDVPAGSEA